MLPLAIVLGIIALAMMVNRITGTKAQYLEELPLEAGERELWRDEAADFGLLPVLGGAARTSFPRLRRHTVVWTNRRAIVAQKPLFSSKRMISHQIYFLVRERPPIANAREAAAGFAGGFYGRGFETLLAEGRSFGRVNGKACVRIQPTGDSSAALNLAEAYIFSDKLAELERVLPP